MSFEFADVYSIGTNNLAASPYVWFCLKTTNFDLNQIQH